MHSSNPQSVTNDKKLNYSESYNKKVKKIARKGCYKLIIAEFLPEHENLNYFWESLRG